MSEPKYKIWCNNLFTATQKEWLKMLVDGIGENEISIFEPKENGRNGVSRKAMMQADIAFGTPDAETLFDCENLSWIQINSAGYTDYERADLFEFLRKQKTILTNSSAVFDEPCAQHLLAMIMSFTRLLPFALDNQRGNKAWRMHEIRSKIQLTDGQTVLILGFGAIGRHLAKLLEPLKMNVIGVKRTIHGEEPIKVISENQLERFLPQTDHLVNILPANDSTDNFLNADRISKLKRGAFVYNIGRGTTVDQNALIENLENRHLGGAFLDVTNPEPLPPENPLWRATNCYITPHVAGGQSREREIQVQHFLNNLKLFERGENLINRIV